MPCGGDGPAAAHLRNLLVVLSASSIDRYSRPGWEVPLERYHPAHSRLSDAPRFDGEWAASSASVSPSRGRRL